MQSNQCLLSTTSNLFHLQGATVEFDALVSSYIQSPGNLTES